mmetsp:Transcript_41534/g.104737  ORF Transcript_41534/g.104737 Transcript_41534/m.104737 type:complete len:248 (+) Transcript_41534:73-816(+)|eukprot:CAMPEP_0174247892 /NCGR_PEP_ID=MMETSP0417-20130205/42773_1 /TAXON_ID=242541 /ORGANISM="Mayorella sp, Strain BSH-02190019" /LENGTH=247 /DNA_ID=CAMNT_0015327753 /DNA_START=146 /DNA_END=889 /DNA_ORIENTATION=+
MDSFTFTAVANEDTELPSTYSKLVTGRPIPKVCEQVSLGSLNPNEDTSQVPQEVTLKRSKASRRLSGAMQLYGQSNGGLILVYDLRKPGEFEAVRNIVVEQLVDLDVKHLLLVGLKLKKALGKEEKVAEQEDTTSAKQETMWVKESVTKQLLKELRTVGIKLTRLEPHQQLCTLQHVFVIEDDGDRPALPSFVAFANAARESDYLETEAKPDADAIKSALLEPFKTHGLIPDRFKWFFIENIPCTLL